MQVTPTQAPVVQNALPQEAVAKTVPQVQAQAAAPLIQRAVDPPPRSERGNQARSNSEKTKGGSDDAKRGSLVNRRV